MAIVEGKKALDLNPNNVDAASELASALIFAGSPEDAVPLLEQALRLNSQFPFWYLHRLGRAHWQMRCYDEALASFEKVLDQSPNFLPSLYFLTCTYAELGRDKEAEAVAANIRRLSPQFTLEKFLENMPYKNQADLERFGCALSKAGLE